MRNAANLTFSQPTRHMTQETHHDYTGSKLGMWIFLVTEMLLFGGLFLVYAVYRYMHPADFHNAAQDLNVFIGTVNTCILLTSSLTMALSIATLQKGQRQAAVWLLLTTILLGIIFLVNKYFEWTAKIHHGIYPNSAEMLRFPQGEILFFGLYYVMTGLHGVHVVAGVVLLSIMVNVIRRKPCDVHVFGAASPGPAGVRRLTLTDATGHEMWTSEGIGELIDSVSVVVNYRPSEGRMRPQDYVALENCGLYWHLVDIIWIFLFPLFYLIT